jgi:hypothetical protein
MEAEERGGEAASMHAGHWTVVCPSNAVGLMFGQGSLLVEVEDVVEKFMTGVVFSAATSYQLGLADLNFAMKEAWLSPKDEH